MLAILILSITANACFLYWTFSVTLSKEEREIRALGIERKSFIEKYQFG